MCIRDSARTPGSLERFDRAQESLAGGVSSGLRRSARPYPLYFQRGYGCRAIDVDGNEYCDFGLALSLIHISNVARLISPASGLSRWKIAASPTKDPSDTRLVRAVCEVRGGGALINGPSRFHVAPPSIDRLSTV